VELAITLHLHCQFKALHVAVLTSSRIKVSPADTACFVNASSLKAPRLSCTSNDHEGSLHQYGHSCLIREVNLLFETISTSISPYPLRTARDCRLFEVFVFDLPPVLRQGVGGTRLYASRFRFCVSSHLPL
jgi:hypothetical protein